MTAGRIWALSLAAIVFLLVDVVLTRGGAR
jgi:hypothetical protein